MSVLTLPNADRLALSVRAKALVFEDPRSRALLQRIEQVAPSQAAVLITGETGTGKEIVARQLHELSRRAQQPWAWAAPLPPPRPRRGATPARRWRLRCWRCSSRACRSCTSTWSGS